MPGPKIQPCLLVVLIVLLMLTGVAPASLMTSAQDKVNVVATTGMVADLARVVGGDRVEVSALMGPGVDPHLYRATASDVQKLQGADIIFYNGLDLEAKLGNILERLGRRTPTYAVASVIPQANLRNKPGFAGFFDPHVWFDVSLWSLAAGAVEEALIKLDPPNAQGYKTRAEEFRLQLAALDDYVKAAIATIPEKQRLMITAHDAFHYYGQRYGIEVTGLQGISTEAEAGVEDVRRLVNLIVERQVPAIFVETSVPQRTIEAVREAARARGQDVRIGGQLFSDAMGDEGTLQGSYIGMVLHNTAVITAALGGALPQLPEMLAAYQPVIDNGVKIAQGE